MNKISYKCMDEKQAGREIQKQTDRQTDRQTNRQTDT